VKAVEKGSELFIVMALNRPDQSIMVAPTIQSFQDLKGKALAVDAAGSGYVLLLKRILAQKGVKEGEYTLKEVGGSNDRYEAIKTGSAGGGLLSQPHDLKLLSEGFKSLGSTSEYFPHYQGSVAATKRSWAAKNQDALVRYIRGYVAASDWLFNPKNREEAIEILLKRVKLDRTQANATYESAMKKTLIPKAVVNLDGLKQVIEVFWESSGAKPPLPSPEKYTDLTYYTKAMQGK
jgi:ABC-type nitrate/sulfonate/bicarbonate transport system substrate-binding protein